MPMRIDYQRRDEPCEVFRSLLMSVSFAGEEPPRLVMEFMIDQEQNRISIAVPMHDLFMLRDSCNEIVARFPHLAQEDEAK